MIAPAPIVTEAAQRAAEASERQDTINFLTFTVVVLFAILVLDVVIEIYRTHVRPHQESSLKPQRTTSAYWRE